MRHTNNTPHTRTRFTLLLWILCLLYVIPALAQGQQPTETPDQLLAETPAETQVTATSAPPTFTPSPTPVVPVWIITWGEEMIYPQAVRFTMTIDRPIDQIASLRLTVLAPGEAQPREVTVVPSTAAALTARTYTEFVYLWQIPSNNPLPFNSDIRYSWEVATVHNESAVLPGVFPYRDPNIVWIRDDDLTGRLSLIYPEHQIDVERLRRSIQPIYTLLSNNTASSPELRLVLYSEAFPFDPCVDNAGGQRVIIGPKSGVELACIPAVMDSILRDLNFDALPLPSLSRASVTDTILRRMVAEFYDPIWQGRDVPEWFKTGMTDFYLPGDKLYMVETVRTASRTDQTYTLAQMAQRDESNPVLWEAQAYTMVLYIARQIGVARLFDLANAAGNGESFATTYENALGSPLSALIPNWRNWVFTGVAASDANLPLYEGATAVPSATSTVTPFPPSVTPTFTPTPTLTPTETPFGFEFTATPLPSRTPTLTYTPAPPTVTPRPARSFEDLTPSPVPPQEGGSSVLDDVDPMLIVGIGGTIMLALLVMIVQSLRRRN